jgi:hypothetical protein
MRGGDDIRQQRPYWYLSSPPFQSCDERRLSHVGIGEVRTPTAADSYPAQTHWIPEMSSTGIPLRQDRADIDGLDEAILPERVARLALGRVGLAARWAANESLKGSYKASIKIVGFGLVGDWTKSAKQRTD